MGKRRSPARVCMCLYRKTAAGQRARSSMCLCMRVCVCVRVCVRLMYTSPDFFPFYNHKDGVKALERQR